MMIRNLLGASLVLSLSACSCLLHNDELAGSEQLSSNTQVLRSTGDLGVIIERASGSVKLIDTGDKAPFADIQGCLWS